MQSSSTSQQEFSWLLELLSPINSYKRLTGGSSLRVERAAKEKAIEACERYYSTYMPLANKFFLLRQEKNLAAYDGPFSDFSKDSLPADKLPAILERFSQKNWGGHLNS